MQKIERRGEMKDLDFKPLAELWVEWNKSNKVERFGQFVLNRYNYKGTEYGHAFNERDPSTAYELLVDIAIKERNMHEI